MDFALTQEQMAIQESVKRYCREKYSFETRTRILRDNDDRGRGHWGAFAQMGWLGVALPQDVNGLGGSAIESTLVLQEFGRCLVCEPFLACAVLAAQTLNAVGNSPACKALLRQLVAGDLVIALAHTEAGFRGIAQGMQSRASVDSDGHYILCGHKIQVLGGGTAQKYLVSALLADGSREERLGVFLVDRDSVGVTRRRYRTIDEHETCDLQFLNVILRPDNLLAEGEAAFAALKHGIEQATIGICAEAVGAMEGIIETTTKYLKSRAAYGTTLSTFQALQHKLADMLVELELSRSALYGALCAICGTEAQPDDAISTAKALIGRSGHFVGASGIQLHGGMGMAEEYIIGHYFKRLTAVEQQFGSSQFHLNRLAASLFGSAG